MKYLLDTNALLYIFGAPSELSARARRIVRSQKDLSVSSVSFWEIAIKQSIGKLKFNMTIPQLEMQCHERNIRILGISSIALERIKELILDGDGNKVGETGYRKGGAAQYIAHLLAIKKKQ